MSRVAAIAAIGIACGQGGTPSTAGQSAPAPKDPGADGGGPISTTACDTRWGGPRLLDFIPERIAVDRCSPAIGGVRLGTNGASDALVAWLDSTGALVRELVVNGRFRENVTTSIAFGDGGDLFVAVSSQGSPTQTAKVGPGDVTISRFLPDGTETWRQTVASGVGVGWGTVLYANGTLWAIASPPHQLTRLDPATGAVLSTSPMPALLPANGQMPGVPSGAAVDGAGYAYLAATVVGPPPLLLQPAGDHYDAFVVKVAPDGHVVWAKQFGTSLDDFVDGIAVDDAGDVYVVGGLGPPAAVNDTRDAFLTKLDADGNVVWRQVIRGSATVEVSPYGVAVTGSGDVRVFGTLFPMYVPLGQFFAGDTGSEWIAAFDPSGALRWAQQLAPSLIGFRLALDAAGHAYLAEGSFPEAESIVKLDRDGKVH